MQQTFDKWFRLVITPIFTFLIWGVSYLTTPSNYDDYYTVLGWKAYLIDFVATAFGSIILAELCVRLSRWLDHLLPWEVYTARRIVAQFVGILIVSLGIIATVIFMVYYLTLPTPNYQLSKDDIFNIQNTFLIGILVAFLATSIYTAAFFFNRWKITLLETEALKTENAEARFETLKSQLDPHFLFNNLNTLTYIVEDNPKAVTFIENFSLVYRYILQNRERKAVTLADELKLAHAYVFLLKNRFGENVRVEMAIEPSLHDALIPPMTLQLLLENAVKHNVIDSKHPLTIGIRSENETLVITNSLRKKQTHEPSSKIGLANIKSRLHLLNSPGFEAFQTESTFVVRVPLKQKN